MQWRMVARRSSGGALTVVGDLAQRVGSPVGSWAELIPAELPRFDVKELTINYRSPAENDDVTRAVLQTISPDLALARSLRRSGCEPVAVQTAEPSVETLSIASAELRRRESQRVAVITVAAEIATMAAADDDVCREFDERLVILAPTDAKGLEFDTVILVEPAEILAQRHGLNLLYVAVTRATQRLVVVHRKPLPEPLAATLEH